MRLGKKYDARNFRLWAVRYYKRGGLKAWADGLLVLKSERRLALAASLQL